MADTFSDPAFNDEFKDVDFDALGDSQLNPPAKTDKKSAGTVGTKGRKDKEAMAGFQPASALLKPQTRAQTRSAKNRPATPPTSSQTEEIEQFSDSPQPVNKKPFNPLLTPSSPEASQHEEDHDSDAGVKSGGPGSSTPDNVPDASPASPASFTMPAAPKGAAAIPASPKDAAAIPASPKDAAAMPASPKGAAAVPAPSEPAPAIPASPEPAPAVPASLASPTTPKAIPASSKTSGALPASQGFRVVQMSAGEGDKGTNESGHTNKNKRVAQNGAVSDAESDSDNAGAGGLSPTNPALNAAAVSSSEDGDHHGKPALASKKPTLGGSDSDSDSDSETTHVENDELFRARQAKKAAEKLKNVGLNDPVLGRIFRKHAEEKGEAQTPDDDETLDLTKAPNPQRTLDAPPPSISSSLPLHSSPLDRIAEKIARAKGEKKGKEPVTEPDAQVPAKPTFTYRAPSVRRPIEDEGKFKSKAIISDSDEESEQDNDDSLEPQAKGCSDKKGTTERPTFTAADNKKLAAEKKKERLERKEGRKQMKADAVTKRTGGHENPAKDFHLGYALINVVQDCDGGDGPELVAHPAQRVISESQVQKLVAVNLVGAGLETKNHKRALIVGVRPETFDSGSIATSVNDELPRIEWNAKAAGTNMVRYAGTHRQAALKESVKPQAKKIEALMKEKEKLERSGKRGAAARIEELDSLITTAEAALEDNSLWVCELVDLTAIEASRDRLIIEANLLKNSEVAQLQDSEQQQLAVLLVQLARADSESARKAILESTKSLGARTKNPVGSLSRRAPELIQFLTRLLQFSSFSTKLELNPALLVDFYFYAWGLLKPVLEGSLAEILFLSSDAVLPAELLEVPPSPISDDDLRTHLLAQLESVDTKYVSTLVMDIVVSSSDLALAKAGLKDLCVGSNLEGYQREWEVYVRIFPELLRKALAESRASKASSWSKASDRAIADAAVLKATTLLKGEHTRHCGVMPQLGGPLPFLCPLLFQQLIDSWVKVGPVVYMITNWFCPALRAACNQIRTNGQYTLPFTSFPAAILHSLVYWFGHDAEYDLSPDTWEGLSPFEVAERDPNDTVHQVWFSIVSHIFSVQESTLLPLCDLLQFIPQANPNGKSGKIALPSKMSEILGKQGVNALEAWRDHIIVKSSVPSASATPRLQSDMPPGARSLAATHPTLLRILTHLQRSPLNFLVPSNMNNSTSHYRNFLDNIYFEDHFYKHTLLPSLESVPQVTVLAHQLLTLVNKHVGFQTFTFWVPFPELPTTSTTSKADDVKVEVADYSDQLAEEDMVKRLANLNKAIQVFARSLAAEDCLGVPRGGSKSAGGKAAFNLHQVLDSPLMDLHAVARGVATDLALIRHEPDFAQWPSYDADAHGSGSYWAQQGVKVKVATSTDMMVLYEVEKVEAAKRAAKEKKQKGKGKGKEKAKVSDDEMDVDEADDQGTGEGSSGKGVKRKNAKDGNAIGAKKARVA